MKWTNPQLELDFSVPVSVTEETSRWKISMTVEDLHIINQLDLIGIYGTLYPITAEYILFKCPWDIYKEHFLGPKINFNKFEVIEIIQYLLGF